MKWLSLVESRIEELEKILRDPSAELHSQISARDMLDINYHVYKLLGGKVKSQMTVVQ